MKRLLSIPIFVVALIIGISGVGRSVAYNDVGVPFNGWMQMNGGYAQVPYQDEINLDPANGSFTIEGWIKDPPFPYSSGSESAIYKKDSFQLGFTHSINLTGEGYTVQFMRCANNYCVSQPYVLKECDAYTYCPAPQGWFYFAYVSDQATNRATFFWNGMKINDDYVLHSSTEPIVLQYANSMDEFRISNNVRYTASFTPALEPFECDGNTQALWHFDEIAGTTTFHDACGAVDNMFVGYNGAHTEGVTGYSVYLPLAIK